MSDWWDDLAVGALLGTDRRPQLETGSLPDRLAVAVRGLSGDPAAVLLDAAALAVAYRRGGVLPAQAVPAPDRARAETRGRPSIRAGRLLGQALAADVKLARFWCESAAAAGLVAPEAQLTALLDLAVSDPGSRPAVAAVLGERGRWLARLRPDWTKAVGATASAGTGTGTGTQPAVDPLPALADLGPGDLGLVVEQLSHCPGPWTEELAFALLRWLLDAIPGVRSYAPAARPLLELMSFRFPLTVPAAIVAGAAQSLADDQWRHRLLDVARTLSARHQIVEELQ